MKIFVCVKQVPDTFLTSRIQYIYDWSQDYKISKIYFMTVLDDKLYESVGFKTNYTATIAGSFTFEQGNSDVKVTTKPTDFTDISRGWIGYADAGFATTNGFIAPNTEFTVTPFWVTKDGVEVLGTARSFTTGAEGSKNTIAEK